MSLFATIAAAYCANSVAYAEIVQTEAEDGTAVFGETYFGDLSSDTPVVALFHLAGGDGCGEYGLLTDWLNEEGFRAIAWDQRSGGDRFGSENRTARAFIEDPGYCAAYQDLQAALVYSVKIANGAPVIVWGSSYSAALVFHLAADYQKDVAGVVSASPASGPPMNGCDLESVISKVEAPVLVLRPEREYEATKDQHDFFISAGIDFRIVEYGVHGSSMLTDERTKQDMSDARTFVIAWLQNNVTVEE